MALEQKEIEQLNDLFKASEGKDSDFIDSLPAGLYLGKIVDCRIHESAASGNFMVKITVAIEDIGSISTYLTSRGNTHFVERFKKICNDLGMVVDNLEDAFEEVVEKEVAVISSATKDGGTFVSVTAEPAKIHEASGR